ncbi:MAG: polysaccharide deacetylase family protein [Pirellulaceae bacterium]
MNVGLPLWKRLVLAGYFQCTSPLRGRRNRRNADAGRAPVMILFYHRIADHTPNDWTLPFARFSVQITWLKEHYDIVSLQEAQRRISCGVNHRPAVSITFDDGYAENCERALPLLIREKLPFTYFVSTDHVLHGRPFPQDVARGQPLAPNTLDEIKDLAQTGAEIGAHTRTHADLGRIHDPQRLVDEIVGCRDDLCHVLNQPVRYFAFPYGRHENLTDEAFRLAKEAGYHGACSAYGGYNFPGDDAFHLQRIHADPEFVRLKNWLTVDPRKVRSVRRFDYKP